MTKLLGITLHCLGADRRRFLFPEPDGAGHPDVQFGLDGTNAKTLIETARRVPGRRHLAGDDARRRHHALGNARQWPNSVRHKRPLDPVAGVIPHHSRRRFLFFCLAPCHAPSGLTFLEACALQLMSEVWSRGLAPRRRLYYGRASPPPPRSRPRSQDCQTLFHLLQWSTRS